MRKILMPRGKLETLSAKTGVSQATCSKYLRGLYDQDNPGVSRSAESVRKEAIALGGAEAGL